MHSPAANLHDSDSTMMAIETTSHGERIDSVDKMQGGSYHTYGFSFDEYNDDKLFPKALFVPESMSRSFLVGSTTPLSSGQDAMMTVDNGGRDDRHDGHMADDEERQENGEDGKDIHQYEPEDVMHHDFVPVEVYFQSEDHHKVAQDIYQDQHKQHCENNQSRKECLELVKEIDRHLLECSLVSERAIPTYDHSVHGDITLNDTYDLSKPFKLVHQCIKEIDRHLLEYSLVSEHVIPTYDHSAKECIALNDTYDLSKPYKLVHQRRDTLMKIFGDTMRDDDDDEEEEDEIVTYTNNVNDIHPFHHGATDFFVAASVGR